jgi:hypothetical protein
MHGQLPMSLVFSWIVTVVFSVALFALAIRFTFEIVSFWIRVFSYLFAIALKGPVVFVAWVVGQVTRRWVPSSATLRSGFIPKISWLRSQFIQYLPYWLVVAYLFWLAMAGTSQLAKWGLVPATEPKIILLKYVDEHPAEAYVTAREMVDDLKRCLKENAATIDHWLAKHPAERYAAPREMAHDLKLFLEDDPTPINKLVLFVWLILFLAVLVLYLGLKYAGKSQRDRTLVEMRLGYAYQWLESQANLLQSLRHVEGVGRVVEELEWLAMGIDRRGWRRRTFLRVPLPVGVDHHRWQTVLKYLWCLTVFSIPFQLMPQWIYDWIPHSIWRIPHWDSIWNSIGWPLQDSLLVNVLICKYVLDWILTVSFIYGVVYVLAPLEEKNLFPAVKDALDRFSSVREAIQSSVTTEPSFSFAGYFWQRERDKDRRIHYTPTVGAKNRAALSDRGETIAQAKRWEAIAQRLHEETLRLDKSFKSLPDPSCPDPPWQGLNSRVAIVCESEPSDGHEPTTSCVHYRRLGTCGFVVAVDSDETRSAGTNRRFEDGSQALFQKLVEGVGRLINIRESLK